MFIIFFSFFGFHFLFLFLFFWQFVTRHPLPVTRHPLPATRYPLPVTRHPRKSPAVHRSARRDKLAVDSIVFLFVDWVLLLQSERLFLLFPVTERFVNGKLVSGKLSKCLYKHSYSHFITSSALNEGLLVHNFQNSCSTECQHVTQQSIEVWLYNNL